jgi:hypothetical protein
VPAILLCQEFDENLKVPSSPPRRLSRSSIDLRDLEAQHEREKIMSQNVSESVSSIYHCFDNQMRYSGSEPWPINAHIKALENQFSMKSSQNEGADDDKNTLQQQHTNSTTESKSSVNNFSFMNNFEQHSVNGVCGVARENDMNLISSASIIKDNQANSNGCSINNNINSSSNHANVGSNISSSSSSSNNNNISNNIYNNGSSNNNNNYNNNNNTNTSIGEKKSFKKKMLASSDSDFFSLLRYNSEKLRRINCFSIGAAHNSNTTTNDRVSSNGGNSGNSANKFPTKNMIYALSDSDFMISVSDNKFSLNNEKKFQAIVNKSDIFNYLNKSFDQNNSLLDNNFAQHNQTKIMKLSDVDCKKQFDNPDFFNVDKLKKVFEESSKIDSSVDVPSLKTSNENVENDQSINTTTSSGTNGTSEKLQKKETVSLPPIVTSNSTSHDINMKLNNSRSIDTVLLNIKNNTDKMYTFKLLYDFSPKAINQDGCMTKNLLKDPTNGSGSESNNINCVQSLNPTTVEGISSILKPVNLNDTCTNGQNHDILAPCDTMNPAYLDDKTIMNKRKRTPSNVTYNVNVIDFQTEDETDGYHSLQSGSNMGGYGKRSNSSTSK